MSISFPGKNIKNVYCVFQLLKINGDTRSKSRSFKGLKIKKVLLKSLTSN